MEREKEPQALILLRSKRDELLALRRSLFTQIKAVERDAAALQTAIRVFDPQSSVSRAIANEKAKRSRGPARRFILDQLREADGKGLTSREIADGWMVARNAKPEESRSYGTRASSTLNILRRDGLVTSEAQEDSPHMLWRLTDRA